MTEHLAISYSGVVVCAWNAIWQRNIDGLESCQTLGRSKLFLSTTKVEIEELSLT